jgi:hypothetical protein
MEEGTDDSPLDMIADMCIANELDGQKKLL